MFIVCLHFILPRRYSADLVHANGSASLLQFLMLRSRASSSSFTESNSPRLRHCRVMIPKKTSTMFRKKQLVGVKCRLTRGFSLSQSRTFWCLQVA